MLKNGEIVHSRYVITGILGKGGSGCVYLVRDLNIGKKWALKEITIQGANGRCLADSEIRMLKQLDEPSIPRILDAWQDRETFMIVSDYIEGISLKTYISEEPLSKSKAYNILVQIARSLRYLHSQDPPVIFMDLKPENIMLKADGKAYLIDFGIAKSIIDKSSGYGTAGYAPPEQYDIKDTDKVDEKADIYAFGITYFTVRTGCLPSPDDKRMSQLIRSSKALGRMEKNFIRDCTCKDPSRRPESMDRVISRLEMLNHNSIKKNVKPFICAFLILIIPIIIFTKKAVKKTNEYVFEMLDKASVYATDGKYDLNGLRVIEEYVNSGNLKEMEGYYTFLVATAYFEDYSMYREAGYYFEKLSEEEYPQKKYYLEICNLETSFDYKPEEMQECLTGLENEILKMPESEEKYRNLLFLSFCFENYMDDDSKSECSERILDYITEHLQKNGDENNKPAGNSDWRTGILNEAEKRRRMIKEL